MKTTIYLYQAPTFYDSIFEYIFSEKWADSENEGEYNPPENEGELWGIYKKEVCSAYANGIFSRLPVDEMGIDFVRFKKVKSPRYYNYETDKSEIEIKIKQKKFLDFYFNEVYPSKIFEEYLAENFTSYSGFISSHDNKKTGKEWTEKKEILENAGLIIDFLLTKTEIGKEIHDDAYNEALEAADCFWQC